MSVEISDAQKEAVDKVREILNEHFESWVLMLGTEVNDHEEITVGPSWHGGRTNAVGLLSTGLSRLQHKQSH